MSQVIDEKQLRDALAANVPRLRKLAGLSQQDLADRVGTHRVTIARVETGRRTPSSDLLFSLADALGVSADTLRQVSAPESSGISG